MKRGVVVAMVVACAPHHDAASSCKDLLDKKLDAIAACGAAFGNAANVDTAKQLVLAHIARGDKAIDALYALNPIGPIGAEIWHKRAGKLRDSGDVDASIRAYDRALALRGGDRAGQVRELVALSERYQTRGELPRALAIDARALETATSVRDPILISHVQTALAVELDLIGDWEGAERTLGSAADVMPIDDPYLSSALILQGELELRRHRPLLARRALERVLELHEDAALKNAHRDLIDVALAAGDLSEAERLLATDSNPTGASHGYLAARVALARGHFDEAEHWIEGGLARKLEPDMRAELEAVHGQILAKQGRTTDAIAALKRAISGIETQLDELGIDELKVWAQNDSSNRAPFEQLFALYAREHHPLEALEVAQRATARAFLDGLASRSLAPSHDVAEMVRAAGARAEALQVVARTLRASAKARTPEASALVRDLGDAIVWTYFVADGDVWLVAIEGGTPTVEDLGALTSIEPLVEGAARLDETSLATLGATLAPPARWTRVTATSVIHIAADAPLDRVPFSALDSGGRRWIERAAIAYVPSAAVLAILLHAPRNSGASVVIGDPVGDLPGARAEATMTGSRLGVTPLLGSAATANDVLGAGRAALLAIASHAEITPGGASLKLADREVTTADIVDRGLAPALVVLASCASAAVDADAWGALAGAFLAAGAPNVIASRWALDDALSRELVAEFYTDGGIDHPAVALAMTQRFAIAHEIPVTAWAALVALGTGETGK